MFGNVDSQKPKKQKKQKKKKLTKAERIALREQQGKKAKEAKAAKLAQQVEAEVKVPILNHPNDGNWGKLLLNRSRYKTNRQWTDLTELSANNDGKEVWIRGRADTIRATGKMTFIMLRRSFCKVQCGVFLSDNVDKDFVHFCGKISPEAIIDVFGVISAKKKGSEILSASPSKLQKLEILVKRCYVVQDVEAQRLPFEINDASRPDNDDNKKFAKVGQDIRLDNRWIDIRTTTNHAIFRMQCGVCKFFREYLLDRGFLEIHSPKLISAASEGGANVFKLKYFGNEAFLAQSPQLYKQMSICSDLFRVFEIGPVFRAEDSNTHRHLCEFTGLDLEMEFLEHYHEVLEVIGSCFIHIFKQLNKYFQDEMEVINKQYPFEPLVFNDDGMLILTFKEAKEMTETYYKQLLKDGKKKEAEDLLMGQSKDFSTPEEKLLGKLVLAKYKTQFYCVDKYPITARPFYTMIDPYNESVSNSYDIFLRGEEIMSGAQRIHDTALLVKQAKKHDIPLHTIQAYIDSFKYATSPHAGGGIGLERVVMLFLGLDNIRKCSLFPRDPKRCSP